MKRTIFCVLLLLLGTASHPLAAQEQGVCMQTSLTEAPRCRIHRGDRLAGRTVVVSGDTIEIRDRRVRLAGVAAPHLDQFCTQDEQQVPCGRQARFQLTELIGRQPVDCRIEDVDAQGRATGTCLVDGVDVGLWMVRKGWALPRPAIDLPVYVQAEAEARTMSYGIWAYQFEPPWELSDRLAWRSPAVSEPAKAPATP